MDGDLSTGRRMERRHADVLVVGAGAAGLRAAIELHQLGASLLVVGKRPRWDAHSVLAAGGINAVLGTVDPADRWFIHAADTLYEGGMLGSPEAVELLCQEAPGAIEELERYGARFARGEDGRLLQRFFGAHRYPRTCFTGDHTGRTIMEALLAEVDRRGIEIVEGIYITDLLLDDGGVIGAAGVQMQDLVPVSYLAGAVIVATGGHTFVYSRTTSRRRENTGDGMALALRVGASLADMEMVQFHPTGMVWPTEVEGTLVTEAVRGEGGRLYNATGERFMGRYDPERMELSSRDRVALANYTEILEGRGTEHQGVWLDISHIPGEFIRDRLPQMVEQFERHGGIDITRERMEVAPTAHYSMGGIRVDPATHDTGIAGLFAAGEVASGVHGANRLGGNSLTECIVFGRRAGEAAAAHAGRQATPLADPEQEGELAARARAASRVDQGECARLIDELRGTMWRRVGLVRDAEGLQEAIGQIETLRHRRAAIAEGRRSSRFSLEAVLDLDSMLLTAEATVRATLLRTESRGAHQRRDHPKTDPNWRRTVLVSQGPDGLVLTTAELAAPSPQVEAVLPEEGEIDITGRLLE